MSNTKTEPFSLLMPVYAGDCAAHFKLAFESSVTQQSLKPNEVVLVQDGPIAADLDEQITQQILLSPVPVKRINLPENRGLAQALNAGLEACSFEIVARMDADDFSLPDRFAQQLPLIAEGYDLVGSAMYEFETDPSVRSGLRVLPSDETEIRRHAKLHNPFNHPTMVYRKSALDSVGNYEEFGSMEDYWLGVRLIAASKRVMNLTQPLVGYRVSQELYKRRGGKSAFATELALQRKLLELRVISKLEFLRNVVTKGAYRLMPARLKKSLSKLFFRRTRDGA